MTASLAPTFSPPNAVRMWQDDSYIYVELPLSEQRVGQPPCIVKFPAGERGLSRALGILRQRKTDFAMTPLVKSRKLVASPQTHAAAQRVLRASGVIK